MQDTDKKSSPVFKIAIVLALACFACFILLRIRPEDIKEWILSFGTLAPVMFILLYSLRPLVMFPASIFMVVGGLAFGVWPGGLYIYIGSIISAVLAFFLARFLGRDFVARILGDRMAKIDKLLEKEGFTVVFYLRLISPYDPLSYMSGLCGISFTAFISATMLAIIPGIFAYANLGNAFSTLSSAGDLLQPQFILSISLIVGVLLLPVIVRIFAKRRAARLAREADSKKDTDHV